MKAGCACHRCMCAAHACCRCVRIEKWRRRNKNRLASRTRATALAWAHELCSVLSHVWLTLPLPSTQFEQTCQIHPISSPTSHRIVTSQHGQRKWQKRIRDNTQNGAYPIDLSPTRPSPLSTHTPHTTSISYHTTPYDHINITSTPTPHCIQSNDVSCCDVCVVALCGALYWEHRCMSYFYGTGAGHVGRDVGLHRSQHATRHT